MNENEGSTEYTEEQLDALADKADQSRNDSRPMTKELEAKPEAPAQMYEFNHNGKPIKAPIDQVLKWASQGYDYPQKIQKFNQERTAWEQERSKMDGQYKVYRDIDTWAKQNPDQWARLEQLYKGGHITQGQALQSAQAQSQGQPANDPYAHRFQSMEQTINQLNQYVSTLVQDRNQVLTKQQDEELGKSIQSIREEYKDLDWQSLDDNGKSLEQRILEYAHSLNMNDGARAFKLAARDLLHDQVIQMREGQAKLNVARGIQDKRKQGVLGESPTPQKIPMFSQPKDIRATSYNDLEREAIAELRSGRFS